MYLRTRFGILGTSVGLVKARANDAAESFLAWQTEIGRAYGFTLGIEEIPCDLGYALGNLFPLTAPIRKRYCFLPVSPEWTAFFDNSVLGTDASGPMVVLARKLNTLAIRAVCAPHTMPPKVTKDTTGCYGANILEVYNEKGDVLRSVYCANDGGKWKFGQSGTPFDFENLSQYEVSRVSEKFTEEMLHRYLTHLAVDAFDETSYSMTSSSGFFFQRMGNGVATVEIGEAEALRRVS